jgi:hypothetical protein
MIPSVKMNRLQVTLYQKALVYCVHAFVILLPLAFLYLYPWKRDKTAVIPAVISIILHVFKHSTFCQYLRNTSLSRIRPDALHLPH